MLERLLHCRQDLLVNCGLVQITPLTNRLADALFNVSNVQPGGSIQGRSDTFLIRGFRTQTYAIDGVFMNQANNF